MQSISNPNDSMTSKKNPQKRAAHTYHQVSQQGISDRQMMAEVYRTAIKNLYLARDAYSNRKLDVMAGYNAKTIKIFDVLREELAASDALKDPEAAPLAKFLRHTYTDLILRLARVLRTPSPVDEFNALAEIIKPIYRAWAPPTPAADTESSTTTTITAG